MRAASFSNTSMKSPPMMRRFCSGSRTPLSSRKKSSDASTQTSFMPRDSRKSASTCSRSFARMRPWSTKMHVSWSPTARFDVLVGELPGELEPEAAPLEDQRERLDVLAKHVLGVEYEVPEPAVDRQ